MFKHATINRTARAQHVLRLQQQLEQQSLDVVDGAPAFPARQSTATVFEQSQDLNNNIEDQKGSNQIECDGLDELSTLSSVASDLKADKFDKTSSISSLSSLLRCTTPLRLNNTRFSSANNSPVKDASTNKPRPEPAKCSSKIRIHAQTLNQDIEYITVAVNSQTTSRHVIKTLLRRFRMKHKDPKLYYLTLERWIRKDGLKTRSTMLLSDEACPLPLQQCCSNPPHDDIKFSLHMHSGALIKIHCSDVVPETRYKCLSLSSHTTVDETIELMLYCLNLMPADVNEQTQSKMTNTNDSLIRNTGSPNSTSSASSTSSRVSELSSSSGVESDPTSAQSYCNTNNANVPRQSDSLNNTSLVDSRTNSVTSISSSSLSTSHLEHYQISVECKDTSRSRVLSADEYLVNVYDGFTAMASAQKADRAQTDLSIHQNSPNTWFQIKLQRRQDSNSVHQLAVRTSDKTMQFERQHSYSPMGAQLPPVPKHTSSSSLLIPMQASSVTSNVEALMSCEATSRSARRPLPPPPQFIVIGPPVRPRRRNLSNASSTFVRQPRSVMDSKPVSNRRRYDPAQLADDLDKLDFVEPEITTNQNN